MRFLFAVVMLAVFVQPAGDDPMARIRAEASSIVGNSNWRPETGDLYERPQVGLSVLVPNGWRVVRKPLSYCTDPVQRIALRGRGATVQIVESLYWGVDGFPGRPGFFTLPGEAQNVSCCPPAEGKGWFIPFRDGRRGFYAYVYLGAPGTRADALFILDSLRVQARRLASAGRR